MIPKTKTVLHPIIVPAGNYCWEHTPPHTICAQFDNEGGHASCSIFRLEAILQDDGGYLKPDVCKCLKEK